MPEYLTSAAITAAYSLMIDRGSVELWFDNADEADEWRGLMRKKARADRLTIRTHARTVRSGPNAGRTLAMAYLPNFKPSAEQMRDAAARLSALIEQARDDAEQGED